MKTHKKLWIAVIALIVVISAVIVVYYRVRLGENKAVSFAGPALYASDTLYLAADEPDKIRTDKDSGTRYVVNEVIVYAADGMTFEDVDALAHRHGGSVVGRMDAASCYQLRFDRDFSYAEMEQFVELLSNEPETDVAFPSLVFELTTNSFCDPNDPWDGDARLWDKNGRVGGSNWGLEAIRVKGAWSLLDEYGYTPVPMGIIDSTIDHSHDDLQLENNVYPLERNDKSTHGMFSAGIMGASSDNGIGICGVAPANSVSRLYAADVGGEFSYYSVLYRITDLVTMQHTRVINISLGNPDFLMYAAEQGHAKALEETRTRQTITQTHLQNLLKNPAGYDFLLCVSAGNSNDQLFKPGLFGLNDDLKKQYGYVSDGTAKDESQLQNIHAEYGPFGGIEDPLVKNHIMVVGAAGRSFSGEYYYCGFSNIGGRIDIAAPGINIYSLDLDNRYLSGQKGTSCAAPYVTGAAALVWAANPELSAAQVKAILIQASLEDNVIRITDGLCGLLDAEAAVRRAIELRDETPDTQETPAAEPAEPAGPAAPEEPTAPEIESVELLHIGYDLGLDDDTGEQVFCEYDVFGEPVEVKVGAYNISFSYDLNCDGQNETVVVSIIGSGYWDPTPFEIAVIDGRTGEECVRGTRLYASNFCVRVIDMDTSDNRRELFLDSELESDDGYASCYIGDCMDTSFDITIDYMEYRGINAGKLKVGTHMDFFTTLQEYHTYQHQKNDGSLIRLTPDGTWELSQPLKSMRDIPVQWLENGQYTDATLPAESEITLTETDEESYALFTEDATGRQGRFFCYADTYEVDGTTYANDWERLWYIGDYSEQELFYGVEYCG